MLYRGQALTRDYSVAIAVICGIAAGLFLAQFI